jgi:uncharacterized protein
MLSPRVIDGLQFARSGSQVHGTLDREQLPRLEEMGCRVQSVAFTLGGGTGSKGKLSLRLRASAQLELVCQRCLEPLAMPIVVDAELELSDSVLEIAQAGDDVDRVLATPAMNVAELVEDELILALPQTPKHESCAITGGAQAGARNSLFEALARLKQGH